MPTAVMMNYGSQNRKPTILAEKICAGNFRHFWVPLDIKSTFLLILMLFYRKLYIF